MVEIGTLRELTNAEGQIVWRAEYLAWGNTLKLHWLTDAAPVEQPLRFQGQYYDEETGLHYNRFRYYDPDLGRFVSQDPLGIQGDYNLFSYAPNPIIWIDPLGLAKRSSKCDAKAKIKEMEYRWGHSDVHALRRHGAGTTLEQQRYRAKTGYTPDQIKKSPVDSSRFMTHKDQLDAFNKAWDKYCFDHGKKGNAAFEIDMGRTVAEGYKKGGEVYQQTTKVKAVFRDGRLLTLYGVF